MTLTLPSGLFDKYYEVCNELLASTFTSSSCTIYFAPLRVACNNCTTAAFGGVSRNHYKHGGPAPFSSGRCPLCGGNGWREQESSASIRLRIYGRPSDWIKIGNINVPNAEVQVIGHASDLPNMLKANEVRIIDNQNYIDGRFQLAGKPFMHGFGKNRYFVAYLKQI